MKDKNICLIDFLIQFSKPSCFTELVLVDFLMHQQFPITFFVVAPFDVTTCTNTAAHLYLQYIHHFELRH